MRKKSVPTNDWFMAVAVLGIAMTAMASVDAQTLPNHLQGPVRVENAPTLDKRSSSSNQQVMEQREAASGRQDNQARADRLKDKREALLRKERFRRRAAEAALKQLEQMAAQLREQLGKEISARQAAETVAAELLSRASLENQIDQERKRLRNEKIKILEERRALLERTVEAMAKRLADERAKRQQIEDETVSLAKTAAERPDTVTKAEMAALRSQVKALERELAAAEWARKLAEAQLKVITDKAGNR